MKRQMSRVHAEGKEASRRPSLLKQHWQELLTFAGSLLGLFFVLLNAGYIQFYEALGVRPEEVGLDRVGVLARTAGLALCAYVILLAIGLVAYCIPFIRKHPMISLCISYGILALVQVIGIVQESVWLVGVLAPVITLAMLLVFVLTHRKLGKFSTAAAVAGGTLALAMTLFAQLAAVEMRIEAAIRGYPVDPIDVFTFPVLDISAHPARVTLMDKSKPGPEALEDPNLLFLGKGPNVAAFLACGNTIIIPTDAVLVEAGRLRPYTAVRDVRLRPDSENRLAFCHCVTTNKGDCGRVLTDSAK
ncbi:hypothetical protein ACFV9D_10000 [Streptomyces sp. NPDC059875]|uniref:hypothetical protein n=1 Tax=unclassified Streptomyces TaxID=2593676 RepID=UPI00364AB8E6